MINIQLWKKRKLNWEIDRLGYLAQIRDFEGCLGLRALRNPWNNGIDRAPFQDNIQFKSFVINLKRIRITPIYYVQPKYPQPFYGGGQHFERLQFLQMTWIDLNAILNVKPKTTSLENKNGFILTKYALACSIPARTCMLSQISFIKQLKKIVWFYEFYFRNIYFKYFVYPVLIQN